MAKEKDLVEQARNTGQRMRARAAPLMDKGFLTEPAAASKRVRTQPGDAQQVNAAPANMMNNSPSALPTPYASGGRVGKCMKCGGPAHKGMCEGGKMAKGGQPKHDDEAQDKKLFKRMYKQEESTEAKGMKAGGKKNWIAGAVKHPGALHRELGVPQGEKIPKSKINAAANSSNPTLARRANFAKTMSKFADGGRIDANMEAYESGPRTKVVPGAAGAGPKKLASGGSTSSEDLPYRDSTGKVIPRPVRIPPAPYNPQGKKAGGSLEKEESPSFPRNKMQKFAVGGVAKIRHEEMTKDQKQTPNKPSGWNAYK